METEYECEIVIHKNVLIKCTQVHALVHQEGDILEYEKVYSSDVLEHKSGSMSEK